MNKILLVIRIYFFNNISYFFFPFFFSNFWIFSKLPKYNNIAYAT